MPRGYAGYKGALECAERQIDQQLEQITDLEKRLAAAEEVIRAAQAITSPESSDPFGSPLGRYAHVSVHKLEALTNALDEARRVGNE